MEQYDSHSVSGEPIDQEWEHEETLSRSHDVDENIDDLMYVEAGFNRTRTGSKTQQQQQQCESKHQPPATLDSLVRALGGTPSFDKEYHITRAGIPSPKNRRIKKHKRHITVRHDTPKSSCDEKFDQALGTLVAYTEQVEGNSLLEPNSFKLCTNYTNDVVCDHLVDDSEALKSFVFVLRKPQPILTSHRKVFVRLLQKLQVRNTRFRQLYTSQHEKTLQTLETASVAQGRVRELELSKQKLHEQVVDLHGKLDASVQKFQATLIETQSARETAEKKLQAAELALVESNTRISQLQKRLQDSDDLIRDAREGQQSTIMKSQIEIENIKVKSESREKELNCELAKMQAEIGKYKTNLENLKNENVRLSVELSAKSKEVSDLTTMNDSLSTLLAKASESLKLGNVNNQPQQVHEPVLSKVLQLAERALAQDSKLSSHRKSESDNSDSETSNQTSFETSSSSEHSSSSSSQSVPSIVVGKRKIVHNKKKLGKHRGKQNVTHTSLRQQLGSDVLATDYLPDYLSKIAVSSDRLVQLNAHSQQERERQESLSLAMEDAQELVHKLQFDLRRALERYNIENSRNRTLTKLLQDKHLEYVSLDRKFDCENSLLQSTLHQTQSKLEHLKLRQTRVAKRLLFIANTRVRQISLRRRFQTWATIAKHETNVLIALRTVTKKLLAPRKHSQRSAFVTWKANAFRTSRRNNIQQQKSITNALIETHLRFLFNIKKRTLLSKGFMKFKLYSFHQARLYQRGQLAATLSSRFKRQLLRKRYLSQWKLWVARRQITHDATERIVVGFDRFRLHRLHGSFARWALHTANKTSAVLVDRAALERALVSAQRRSDQRALLRAGFSALEGLLVARHFSQQTKSAGRRSAILAIVGALKSKRLWELRGALDIWLRRVGKCTDQKKAVRLFNHSLLRKSRVLERIAFHKLQANVTSTKHDGVVNEMTEALEREQMYRMDQLSHQHIRLLRQVSRIMLRTWQQKVKRALQVAFLRWSFVTHADVVVKAYTKRVNDSLTQVTRTKLRWATSAVFSWMSKSSYIPKLRDGWYALVQNVTACKNRDGAVVRMVELVKQSQLSSARSAFEWMKKWSKNKGDKLNAITKMLSWDTVPFAKATALCLTFRRWKEYVQSCWDQHQVVRKMRQKLLNRLLSMIHNKIHCRGFHRWKYHITEQKLVVKNSNYEYLEVSLDNLDEKLQHHAALQILRILQRKEFHSVQFRFRTWFSVTSGKAGRHRLMASCIQSVLTRRLKLARIVCFQKLVQNSLAVSTRLKLKTASKLLRDRRESQFARKCLWHWHSFASRASESAAHVSQLTEYQKVMEKLRCIVEESKQKENVSRSRIETLKQQRLQSIVLFLRNIAVDKPDLLWRMKCFTSWKLFAISSRGLRKYSLLKLCLIRATVLHRHHVLKQTFLSWNRAACVVSGRLFGSPQQMNQRVPQSSQQMWIPDQARTARNTEVVATFPNEQTQGGLYQQHDLSMERRIPRNEYETQRFEQFSNDQSHRDQQYVRGRGVTKLQTGVIGNYAPPTTSQQQSSMNTNTREHGDSPYSDDYFAQHSHDYATQSHGNFNALEESSLYTPGYAIHGNRLRGTGNEADSPMRKSMMNQTSPQQNDQRNLGQSNSPRVDAKNTLDQATSPLLKASHNLAENGIASRHSAKLETSETHLSINHHNLNPVPTTSPFSSPGAITSVGSLSSCEPELPSTSNHNPTKVLPSRTMDVDEEDLQPMSPTSSVGSMYRDGLSFGVRSPKHLSPPPRHLAQPFQVQSPSSEFENQGLETLSSVDSYKPVGMVSSTPRIYYDPRHTMIESAPSPDSVTSIDSRKSLMMSNKLQSPFHDYQGFDIESPTSQHTTMMYPATSVSSISQSVGDAFDDTDSQYTRRSEQRVDDQIRIKSSFAQNMELDTPRSISSLSSYHAEVSDGGNSQDSNGIEVGNPTYSDFTGQTSPRLGSRISRHEQLGLERQVPVYSDVDQQTSPQQAHSFNSRVGKPNVAEETANHSVINLTSLGRTQADRETVLEQDIFHEARAAVSNIEKVWESEALNRNGSNGQIQPVLLRRAPLSPEISRKISSEEAFPVVAFSEMRNAIEEQRSALAQTKAELAETREQLKRSQDTQVKLMELELVAESNATGVIQDLLSLSQLGQRASQAGLQSPFRGIRQVSDEFDDDDVEESRLRLSALSQSSAEYVRHNSS